ncbi:MAG TPA: hypothetical protein VET89_00655 [Stellaceae bacterium]|nr:hypothetical protein [Stellaceae bacterium]
MSRNDEKRQLNRQRPRLTAAAVAAMLLLAGCGGGEGWTRLGADAAAVSAALADCQAVTATATKTDIDIDQDIAATRGSDLQRSDLLRLQTRQTHDTNRDRAAAILAGCMQAKGFRPGK